MGDSLNTWDFLGCLGGTIGICFRNLHPRQIQQKRTSNFTVKIMITLIFWKVGFFITGQIIFCLGVSISAYIIERYLNTFLVFKSIKAPSHRLLVLDSQTAFASQFRRGHSSWWSLKQKTCFGGTLSYTNLG